MKTTKPQKQKSEDAAKKHANAERLRRDRINLHLTKLRSLLLPNRSTSKTVKASILAETVRQVKELKKKAADQMAVGDDWEGWCGGGGGGVVVSGSFMFPGESDEATVSCGEDKMVKATVCCEDRPGLNRELTEAIRSVGARVVRAEMATVGGRTKAELLVQCREGGAEEEGVVSLKRALKAVVETGASDCSGLGQLLSLNRYNRLGLEIPANKWAGVSGSFNSSGEWEKLLLRTL